jgi:hypothetical protein
MKGCAWVGSQISSKLGWERLSRPANTNEKQLILDIVWSWLTLMESEMIFQGRMNLSFILIIDADVAPELDNGWIIQHHPPPDKWIKKREGKKKLK